MSTQCFVKYLTHYSPNDNTSGRADGHNWSFPQKLSFGFLATFPPLPLVVILKKFTNKHSWNLCITDGHSFVLRFNDDVLQLEVVALKHLQLEHTIPSYEGHSVRLRRPNCRAYANDTPLLVKRESWRRTRRSQR